MKCLSRLVAFILIANIFSCKPKPVKVERAFYYWKSNEYNFTANETGLLKKLKIQKLYVKFFEVETDDIFGNVPAAKSNIDFYSWFYNEAHNEANEIIPAMEITPVIFIRNNVLRSITPTGLDSLASNIVWLVNKYVNEKFHDSPGRYKELQLDCDWTKSTRDNYFALLKKVKQVSGKKISCTLRLYPYKYRKDMGIPPVDRATLMCYNLLNPLESENRNSILEPDELAAYLKGVKKYPVHLDIALPAFSWLQAYQNRQFTKLIYKDTTDLTQAIRPVDSLWYVVEKDITIGDVYFREGDKIKAEIVSEKSVNKAIRLLRRYLDLDENTTITLFHLDEVNLKQYSNETLTGFYYQFTD